MKIKEFQHKPVQPDTYEASMALQQLMRIAKCGMKLHNMIDNDAEMESWVAKKIDLASNYVKSVHGYTAGSKAGAYDDDGMSESREQIGDYAREIKSGRIVRIVDYTDDDEGIYTISYGDNKGENDVTAKDLKFLDQTGGDQEEIGKFDEDDKQQASDKEVKMAKGVAFDKRYKDGNYSGAYKTINKIKPGLSDHPDVADALRRANEDAGFDVEAWSTDKVEDHGPDLMRLAKGQPIEITAWDSYYMDMDDGRPDDDQGNVAADDSIGGEVTSAIRGHMDDIQKADFVGDTLKFKPTADTIKYAQNIIKSPEFKKAYQSTESVSEDAGEGHMSKSQLYQTAKMSIELLDMIKKGDDLEGWVQTKLNLAADYLQAVYHYEDYQKLNPYREEIDSSLMQRHAGIIQKHLDEILSKETNTRDVDTKPGMMKILKKRVNEVEKEIAKENRKETDEVAPPGREKQVKKLKGKFKDKGAPYAIAWAQHNKHGKPNNEAELEEGIKDWAKNLAMAGVVVAGLAGVGSIQDAIDSSVPAVQAMETALELAQDQGNTELADMIEKDLSAVKVRLSSGKDLNFVKGMQEKYSKFVKTEGLAYESKLAIMLNQQLK